MKRFKLKNKPLLTLDREVIRDLSTMELGYAVGGMGCAPMESLGITQDPVRCTGAGCTPPTGASCFPCPSVNQSCWPTC